MNKKKELTKNTILIFISKFFTSTITFLLIPLYTRLLSTSDYGYVDLVQTYVLLIVPILLLRFDSAVFRFLVDARKNEDEKKSIISVSLLSTFIQSLLFSLIAYLVNFFVDINYFKYILINIIIMGISQILLQTSRGLGNIKEFSIGSIISGVVSVLCNVFFIAYLKKGAEFILISNSIGNAVTIFYIIVVNKIYKYYGRKYISIFKIKEMLYYSLPMLPDGLSWWIVNVSDRSIITSFLGTNYNGIYAISGKFSNILATIFGIFNMAWQESTSLHINDEDRNNFFSDIFNTTLIIYSSLCFGIIALLPLCFNILVGADYIGSYKYIPILIIGNIFNGLAGVTGGIYIAQKATKSVAKTTVVSAIVNIIINLCLIKFIGLWAACLSTLISYMILCLYRFWHIRREFRIIVKPFNMFSIILIGAISIFLFYINNLYLNILNIVIVGIWAILFNKSTIKKFMNLFLKKQNKGD